MPYIKLEERPKFTGHITEVLNILREPTDALYVKGEYFGFFVNRLVKRYLADPDYVHNSFNSAHFSETKKKVLTGSADHIAALITRGDPIGSAGELNYVITAVLWGFLGQAEGFAEAGYGLRTYLRGIIDRITVTVETVNTGSARDMTMAFRRHLVIRGVLGDVIDETYRRQTATYEEKKLVENHDIWGGQKLLTEAK